MCLRLSGPGFPVVVQRPWSTCMLLPGSLCLLKGILSSGPRGVEPRAECCRAVPSLPLCPTAAPCFCRVVSSQCRVCLDLRATCPCALPCPGPGAVTTIPLIKGRLTQMAALCFFPCSVGQRRSALGWWVQALLEQVWGCLVSVCVCPQGTPPRLSIAGEGPSSTVLFPLQTGAAANLSSVTCVAGLPWGI